MRLGYGEMIARGDRLLGQRQALQSELASVQEEIRVLKYRRDLYSRTVEVLKQLIEKTTERDLQKVETFVSMGLHKAIGDQVIDCRIKPHPTAGASKILITASQETPAGLIEGPFTENFGGGAWNIASVILRIITILKMKLRRRLFLDESLNNLSVEYHPAMVELMSSLVRKMLFECLLVTHLDRLTEGADRVYRASRGNGELTLSREV